VQSPTTPEPRRGRFRWRDFVVAAIVSVVFHVTVVIPRVLAPLVDKPERPVEVAIIDPDARPTDDATAKPDETPPTPTPEKPEPPKPKKPEPPKPPPPEPATVEAPKPPPPPEPPKPEPPPPPKPETPPPPPPILVDKRKQMVDQDKFPDEEDNPDAKYLAQKNHRAAEETRAKDTNLLRNVESENDKASADDPNNRNRDPDPGAKEQKIAELQDREGPDKTLPRGVPEAGEDVKPQPTPQKTQRGPLAMRDLVPKGPERAKARDGTEVAEGEQGDLPRARAGSDRDPGRAPRAGLSANLKLDHKAYDRIEGFDVADKERREAARAERSLPKGYYSKYLAKAKAMRSAIENFTPDVKPGNQQELGTRASPFAAYITAMHRQIHKLFTFGFLADIEGRRGPYDDESLWTQLQIVINPDGKVDKVTIVRGSGVLGFDVAAIDSVMSAAPFPIPPKAIRSTNGKVYMDWQFHRDERACGTFGVDPYILTVPGQEQPHDTTETGAGHKEAAARAALLGTSTASAGPSARPAPSGSGSGSSGSSSGSSSKPAPPSSPAAAVTESSSEPSRPPPRRLARGGDDGGDDDERPSVRPSPQRELAAAVPVVTAEARSAAEGWFAAYARGDVGWMAGWSATPFVAGGHVVARDAAKLKSIFKQLLAESPSTRGAVEKFEVLTPAGLRGKLGGLPPGGEDDMLFATGRVGGEELVLFLKRSSTGWRVAGLAR
jgi:TonB family protein